MTLSRSLRLQARTLARLWRRHGWLLIGLLWVAALVLGYWGFQQTALDAGEPGRFFDLAYRTLLLISMNSGDLAGAGWQLNAARFLLPFLAAWTAFRALLSLFRNRWQQFLLRFWRDHTVICGLSRKGWLLAQAFASRGDRVVVLEAREEHDLIARCREHGIAVLAGDATNPELLRQAGEQSAAHLVAVTDDDGVNAEIAVRAQELIRAAEGARRAGGRRTPLTCTVHLVDPQLRELARTREIALEESVPFQLELFNVFDRGARLLWSQFGPVDGNGGAVPQATDGLASACSAHVLVIGLGWLGESLVAWAARDWHTRLHDTPCRASGRLRITVIDQEADWKCRALGLRYPKLAAVCDLIPLTMNVSWPEFYEGAFLAGSADFPPVGVVFVCFDADSLALRTGLVIQQRLLHSSAGATPVVIRVAEAGGLARLVDPGGAGPAAFAHLHAFGLLDRTCTPEAILCGTHEVLALGLHYAYLQQQRALGHTAAMNPSVVEWDHLPEALRESNRAAARALLGQLSVLGYALAPLSDWDAAFFRFSGDEMEQLAEAEHNRFVAERLSRGWRQAGSRKDTAGRRSPALLPWDELPEEERTKNRDAVSELPATLARAGFQLVRLAPTDRQAAQVSPAQSAGPSTANADRREVVARAIHERYRHNQRGIKPPDDPIMQPWEVLAEPLREFNRQQADDIPDLLQLIGFGMRPAEGRPPAPFLFSQEDVETMAVPAHERWVAARLRAGWLPGPERDTTAKFTPYLVPYADLPPQAQEWDRQAVRAIPEVLAAAGWEVYRL